MLGISKIKTRYKSFESRRQLASEYDVFLADDRVIPLLPRLLGKTVYEGTKRPIPVSLEAPKLKGDSGKTSKTPKDAGSKSVMTPKAFANEIEKAVSSARVHLAPSTTTSVCVGFSNYKPQELAENVQAVVTGLTERFITKGWRNVRAIHVKGPETVALPIWQTSQLWVEDEDVIEDVNAEEARQIADQKTNKRKLKNADADGAVTKKSKLLGLEEGLNAEMKERRAKLRQQKQVAREEAEMGKIEGVSKPETKVKVKKTKKVMVSS